ncbi:MAG: tetratricopeptide repeat protein [Fluviicola sp.]|nr:tetratricopeptide repeat protein [Fluviicola sp.]
METYRSGDVFFQQENADYSVYKVIQLGENNQLYVKAYWSTDVEPTVQNRKSLDVRTACEAMQLSSEDEVVFLTNEAVSNEELDEYANFKRIEAGLKQRSENLVVILDRGAMLLQEGKIEEALAVFTEATSYSKYDYRIFDQRGYCLLQLGRYSEAVADLEHSLTIQPEGKNTLFYCAEAYFQTKQFEKAAAKLEQLEKIDPTYVRR